MIVRKNQKNPKEEMTTDNRRTIAHFSMEIGFDPETPTYSGGLGILAGDTIRSAADLNAQMVAVPCFIGKATFTRDSNGCHSRMLQGDLQEDIISKEINLPYHMKVTISCQTNSF